MTSISIRRVVDWYRLRRWEQGVAMHGKFPEPSLLVWSRKVPWGMVIAFILSMAVFGIDVGAGFIYAADQMRDYTKTGRDNATSEELKKRSWSKKTAIDFREGHGPKPTDE